MNAGGIHARDWAGWFLHRSEINKYLVERGYETIDISVYGLTTEGYWRHLRDDDGQPVIANDDALKVFTHWKSPAHGEWVIRTILGE